MIGPQLWRAAKSLSTRSMLQFMRVHWQKKNEEFKVGPHTRGLAAALDSACDRLRHGLSTYLMVKFPFRHGKSEMVSRYFPCHFLGEFPDEELIVTSYSASLVYTCSRFARRILTSSRYRGIYPETVLSRDAASVEQWSIANHQGGALWTGLGGSIVGKGATLAIVDDFYKGREEAESEKMRDKRWEDFTNAVMTRLAPVHIVLVIGTPWHVDDIFGRISKSMAEEPDFPYFQELRFPAESSEYPSGTLFPERFSKKWYRAQRKVLGPYAASGLLDCDPQARHGRMLRGDLIVEKPLSRFPPNLTWVRGYDLASSEKQRAKDDPDYTVGSKVAVVFEKTEVPGLLAPIIYVSDLVRGQWEATERDKKIISTAQRDGMIPIAIEAFGAYKDAYTVVKKTLAGTRGVSRINLPGDKVAKASALEPILSAGHFIVAAGAPWVKDLRNEFLGFPSAKHDDIVDSVRVAYELASKTVLGLRIPL